MTTNPSSAEWAPDTTEQVFQYVLAFKQANDGNAPSLREIADGCNLSRSAVQYHLTSLELANRIRIHKHRRRMIEIVGGQWDYRPDRDP